LERARDPESKTMNSEPPPPEDHETSSGREVERERERFVI